MEKLVLFFNVVFRDNDVDNHISTLFEYQYPIIVWNISIVAPDDSSN